MAGEHFLACDKVIVLDKSVDPYGYVISVNLHRRHLTAEQKRELIAQLLKATPEKSDRQIAETVKAKLRPPSATVARRCNCPDWTVAKARRQGWQGAQATDEQATYHRTKGRRVPCYRLELGQRGARCRSRQHKRGRRVARAESGTRTREAS